MSERDLEWKLRRGIADEQRYYTNPKLAIKQDEVAVQSYISQKLAPFDDYQFEEEDKEKVAKYIRERLQ